MKIVNFSIYVRGVTVRVTMPGLNVDRDVIGKAIAQNIERNFSYLLNEPYSITLDLSIDNPFTASFLSCLPSPIYFIDYWKRHLLPTRLQITKDYFVGVDEIPKSITQKDNKLLLLLN